MAQKRMFDKSLIDSDLFIDLSIPSQCLYFHLSMRADDEGFIGNVKGILRLVGFKEEDLRPLIEKQFVILFKNGVIVIKHWKLNNYLRSDRIKPTAYQEEKLQLVDNKGYYELGCQNGNQMATVGIPSIEESSIEESSIEENIRTKNKLPTLDEVKNYCLERNNDVDYNKWYDFYESKGWLVGKTKMVNWKACVRTWEKHNNEEKLPSWFDKDIKEQKATAEQQKEMDEIFKKYKEEK